MKTTKIPVTISLLLILIIAGSCRSSRSTTGKQYPRNPTYPTETPTRTATVSVNGNKLPPGQAKKIYGGQSAKAYAPGQTKKYGNRYPLVIVYSPDIVISRHIDGRYYYKSKAGHTYWKGSDGRYFLDEKHLKEIEYEEGEYEDWKFKGQKNDKAQESKGKEQEEKVKEETKEKVAGTNGKDKNQKAKGNDQKGKDQTNQKAKDDSLPKGKSKSKA